MVTRIVKITLLAILMYSELPAADVSYTSNPVLDTGWGFCGNILDAFCDTTAHFDSKSLLTGTGGDISPLFLSAFSTWNTSGDWTLQNGGSLSGFFSVTASAQQFNFRSLGGVTIVTTIDGITNLPALTGNQQLVWVQGLYENYSLSDGSIVAPFYTMDITAAGVACGNSGPYPPTPYCGPAYPFQFADGHFGDQPKAFYDLGSTQAFFQANAYLAVEDAVARTLTVYDGISYGFTNEVSASMPSEAPEPGTVWLLSSNLLAILWYRLRGRKSRVQ